MIRLRDYQGRVVQDTRSAIKSGSRRPLIVMPTGSGKTPTAGWIASQSASNGKRVLFIAHRQELVAQAAKTFAALGIHHDLIVAGKQQQEIERKQWLALGRSMVRPGADVVIASVQTLTRRLDIIGKFDVVMIDEAHHTVQGNTWGKVFDAYPRALGIGFTATPERLDGHGLGRHADGYFDSIVKGPSVQHLIDNGYLAPPEVYVPNVVDMKGAKKSGGDYSKADAKNRMGKAIYGDSVEHYGRLCPGEPAVAFCCDIASAESAAEQYRAAGFRAAAVSGKMSDEERAEKLGGLADGSYHVITSADLIGEGLDIPAIRAVIMLRPTDSLGLYRQWAGRGLRPYEGKESCIILDHVGNTLKHGFITDDIDWSLDGRAGRKAASDSEPEINVRQCPECFYAHVPAPTCPHCGHDYPVQARKLEEVDGQLGKVTSEEIARQRAQKRNNVAQCKTVEDFVRAGFSADHGKHVIAARAEKAELRSKLKSAIDNSTREQLAAAEVDAAGVMQLKPKQLQQAIDRIEQVKAANDNNDKAGGQAGLNIRASV